MITNLTTRKENKLQLNGNLITGDTFPIKDFVKAYCGGKWDSNSKGWRVDLDKLNHMMSFSNMIGLRIDTSAKVSTKSSNGLCPHCHTYCYGDCQSH